MRISNIVLFLFTSLFALFGNEKNAVAVKATKGFRIESASYEQCLVHRNRFTPSQSYEPSLTLRKCDQNSTGFSQRWVWTSRGQLRLKGKKRCLTASQRGVVFLQRCRVDEIREKYEFQQWECMGNLLKLKYMNAYLVPFHFSSKGINIFGILARSVARRKRIGTTVYGAGEWSRQGTGASLCGDLPF